MIFIINKMTDQCFTCWNMAEQLHDESSNLFMKTKVDQGNKVGNKF